MDVNKAISPVGGVAGLTGPEKSPKGADKVGGPDFGQVLTGKVEAPKTSENGEIKATGEGIRFSNHALERMTSRGISFQTGDVLKLNEAVEKASQKGSQNALVLMGNNAFVVSVKNKTVVTAMDREAMKENVFTNIDSTIIL